MVKLTKSQAIDMQEARIQCMKNEISGTCNKYCEDCKYCYEQGLLLEQIESLQILIDIAREDY